MMFKGNDNKLGGCPRIGVLAIFRAISHLVSMPEFSNFVFSGSLLHFRQCCRWLYMDAGGDMRLLRFACVYTHLSHNLIPTKEFTIYNTSKPLTKVLFVFIPLERYYAALSKRVLTLSKRGSSCLPVIRKDIYW